MPASWLPLWESHQQGGSGRPSPPAAPTSWQFACSMCLYWHVIPSLLSRCSQQGLGCNSDVCCADPHAEPFHLQPEKQRHEEGLGETPEQKGTAISISPRTSFGDFRGNQFRELSWCLHPNPASAIYSLSNPGKLNNLIDPRFPHSKKKGDNKILSIM